MLKYLIIPLSRNSTSFCHYSTISKEGGWISTDILRKAILWAMKENISVQFVCPTYTFPKEISTLISTIDHTIIVPYHHSNKDILHNADVIVFENLSELSLDILQRGQVYIVKSSINELNTSVDIVKTALTKVDRLNIVIRDIEKVYDGVLKKYNVFLECLIPVIIEQYKNGHNVQLNILTDRLLLKNMNNCNAGTESITLAPDGNFYICPAFFLEGEMSVGNLERGIEMKNYQLFKLSHAPICRICDAYQCRRCVWLNKKMTREVNTPSRQQCIIAHTERNASKKLLEELKKFDSSFLYDTLIPEIDYIDPFDKLTIK